MIKSKYKKSVENFVLHVESQKDNAKDIIVDGFDLTQ